MHIPIKLKRRAESKVTKCEKRTKRSAQDTSDEGLTPETLRVLVQGKSKRSLFGRYMCMCGSFCTLFTEKLK